MCNIKFVKLLKLIVRMRIKTNHNNDNNVDFFPKYQNL